MPSIADDDCARTDARAGVCISVRVHKRVKLLRAVPPDQLHAWGAWAEMVGLASRTLCLNTGARRSLGCACQHRKRCSILQEFRPPCRVHRASELSGPPSPDANELQLGVQCDGTQDGVQKPTERLPGEYPRVHKTPSRASALQLLRQMLQLAVVCALLLLFPAWTHAGGLSVARVWQAYLSYLAFFGVGSVSRMVRFGGLAPRSNDKQVVSYKSSVALAAFIFFMPLFHWTAISRYLYYQWYLRPLVAYDLLAVTGLVVAVGLHFWAAQSLGQVRLC
jgi:hypothetical protein